MTEFSGEQHLCLSDSKIVFFFSPGLCGNQYNRWCKITHSPELLVNVAREGVSCVGVLSNLSQPNFPSAPAFAPTLFFSKSPATRICCLCVLSFPVLLCLSEDMLIPDSTGFAPYTTLTVTRGIVVVPASFLVLGKWFQICPC